MNIEQKITFYLENQDDLFKDWYKEQSAHDAEIDFGEEVGAYKDYKLAFNKWVNIHKSDLRKRICPNKKEIIQFTSAIAQISAIMALIEKLSFVAEATITATGLLIYGIENLCDTNES